MLVLVCARFVGVVGYSEMFGYAAGLCRLVALVVRGDGGLDWIVWCFNSVGTRISFVGVCVGFTWYGFVLVICWLYLVWLLGLSLIVVLVC